MFDVQQTQTFYEWLTGLKDRRAVWLISSRLDRLKFGHLGDVSHVGDGVCELRIHFGPGYRVYFQRTGPSIIILLCGGDKGSQARDIQKAGQISLYLQENGHDGKTLAF